MAAVQDILRITMAAGGTGGHVYPAIAIADAIKAKVPEAQIDFIGTSTHMEWQAVPKAGYKIHPIWISGFQRRVTLANIWFPLKLLVSLIQSHLLLSKMKPNAVICTGGYVSGPVGITASRKSIPLYVQEQNSFPGVANRLLVKYAKRIYIAFDEARKFIQHEDIANVGNPVRKALEMLPKEEGLKVFSFKPNRPTLLVIGGSLGARTINEAMIDNIANLHDRLGLQIIWQTGSLYINHIKERIQEESYQNLVLTDYLHNMPAAYSAADVVVSRAGASSLSELQNLGKASILIPSPNVAGNHQYHNAKSMERAGASILLEDHRAKDELVATVNQLFSKERLRESMQEKALEMARSNAAERIASDILADLNISVNQKN